MSKKVKFLSLGLVFALVMAQATHLPAKATENSDLTKLQEFAKQAETKPSNVRDTEIAWFLSLGIPVSEQKKNPGVIMWQGPLRVAVQDDKGDDLDLTTYPGNVIKFYFDALSTYTKLAIAITKAENHDNTASIVVSDERMSSEAGAINGVPELASRPKKQMSGLLKNYYVPKAGVGPEEINAGSFRVNYTTKACAINIVIPKNTIPDLKFVWDEANMLASFCLAPAATAFWGEAGEPEVKAQAMLHPFYFWKVFYHSGIIPGMKQKEAEQKALKYLTRTNIP